MTIERRGIGTRLSILQYVITVIFSILAVSFWVLQVVEHAKFEEMAENNHQRTLALRAPRGLVFDRAGRVLVENRHSYSISIVREHTKDLDRTIRLLSGVLEVSDAQVSGDDTLKSGDIVGQSGIEKVYNAVLMGEDGARRVVVNSVGREIRTLEEDAPTEGRRVQLTIDYDVQKAIEDGFDSIKFNGAAVVLDPSNSDVAGFTSRPAYDPNAFASGIDRATWASLTTDEDRPLND